MIKLKNILIAVYGLLTVSVFILMIMAGGLFNSVNALLYREISFIISPFTINGFITIPLYRLYNILLFIFSALLFLRTTNLYIRLGSLFLSMSVIFGLLLIRYPLDPSGESVSFTALSHISIAIIIVLYIFTALTLFGYGFKRYKNLSFLYNFSTELSVIILFLGFAAGVFAYLKMPAYVGLFQKLPIMSFLVWIVVTSLAMLKSDKRIKYKDTP